ncbi:MAG: methyltransferase family protein [Terriglobia bacterium]
MSSTGQIGRFGALAVLGVGAAELLIMISPFAGFFYASLRFDPFLGLLSQSAATAWLDGFFLNHSVVTASALLEWQRRIGVYLFGLGLGGFLLSALQVYGNKLRKRGVAQGLLYRFVRHPQYLCLGIAGWGLLTMWPRFLLLGAWVTMLFLYAGLARFEERRMEERFGDAYRRFAQRRGAFLPRSPVRRLFEASFGRLRPRPLGWGVAYAFCLTAAFSLGFALRATTRASTAILFQPAEQTVVVSAWPQPAGWVAKVYQAALADDQVQQRLRAARGDKPIVATILPPKYGMRGMFYKPTPAQRANRKKHTRGPLLGVDPDTTNEPVEVVFSRAQKPYKEKLALAEALDPSVRLTPLVVVEVLPASSAITGVRVPLPQNVFGPNVVMPLL